MASAALQMSEMFDNKLHIWKHSFLIDLYRVPVVNRTERLGLDRRQVQTIPLQPAM